MLFPTAASLPGRAPRSRISRLKRKFSPTTRGRGRGARPRITGVIVYLPGPLNRWPAVPVTRAVARRRGLRAGDCCHAYGARSAAGSMELPPFSRPHDSARDPDGHCRAVIRHRTAASHLGVGAAQCNALAVTSARGPTPRLAAMAGFHVTLGAQPWYRRGAGALACTLAFEAAVANPSVHAAQHTSFLGGARVWWVVVRHVQRTKGTRSGGVLSVTMIPTGALGALLKFGPGALVPELLDPGGLGALTPLEDQQLGGLVMWIPGGMIYAAAALWGASTWVIPRRPARRDRIVA